MSQPVQTLSFDTVIDRLLVLKQDYQQHYLAMYSSWYGGIIKEPALMMVPVDDHLVHRGDGIFEAFKCVRWNLYGLERHLDRLERSARGASLNLPMSRAELTEIILATVRSADVPDCLVRLFISRGPGGFSTNPYECPASQVYIVVTTLKRPPRAKYQSGVTLKSSHIPIKQSYFANMKSCNYLPNVLMKKEAEDAGVDYTVSIDEKNFLGEGPTENIGIITSNEEFLVPRFDRILQGITLTRLLELAQELVPSGILAQVAEADITREQAYEAREIMVFGTTFDILPVVAYDGKSIGEGRPGPFYRRFLDLIEQDMRTCRQMLTPVKE
ncbi:aminotransferase class IV [Desulfoferrobacter suflitae]|uniref:aminotransferase class IV n=1 Tax=Desulfoferrobacter suflitae TaxID=2865782 RepID=UPI0021644B49|nr:aminotransferase class IV [Desulfoferrobacter suflitae]MCK8600827.1 aminotransferase class IV [Desulfoferrobacter suflitae]